MLRVFRFVSPLLALSALVACGPGGGGGVQIDTRQPKLSVIRDEIFIPRCGANGCHGGANPAADLQLTSADVHAAIVDVESSRMGWRYVFPGAAEESLLVAVLKEATEGIPRMPAAGTPLEEQDIRLIERWIEEGALDD